MLDNQLGHPPGDHVSNTQKGTPTRSLSDFFGKVSDKQLTGIYFLPWKPTHQSLTVDKCNIGDKRMRESGAIGRPILPGTKSNIASPS